MSERVLQLSSYRFWNSSGSALMRYTPVSLATGSEITDAAAAGVPSDMPLIVPTPIASGLATRPVLGIAQESARSGTEVLVATAGDVLVMANAAIAINSRVLAAAAFSRTSAQTPLINLLDANIPIDPSVTLTYVGSLIDDPAISAQSSSANVLYYPVGWALEAAAAQYELIQVRLDFTPFYA